MEKALDLGSRDFAGSKPARGTYLVVYQLVDYLTWTQEADGSSPSN